VLFSAGCGSVQHVSCFSHVTTYGHSSPSICTLLRSMHAYTGDWEILLLSNLENKTFKKNYFQSLTVKFQQMPDCFIVREEVICVELF